MEFEWDEAKSARNIRERNLPFEAAAAIFRGPVLEWEDARRAYPERRFIAVGEADGRCLTGVYTWREGRRRIIPLARGEPRRAP